MIYKTPENNLSTEMKKDRENLFCCDHQLREPGNVVGQRFLDLQYSDFCADYKSAGHHFVTLGQTAPYWNNGTKIHTKFSQ